MSDVTEHSLIIAGGDPPRSKGGRPRKFKGPGYPVSSWVPERDADELMRLASYNGVSVSEFVCGLIVRAVKTSKVSYE